MEKRKYANYNVEQVKEFTKESTSMSQLLKKLDLKCAGGNYVNMRRYIQRNEIDCSHWKGQGWNKGDQLKDWSEYTRVIKLKPHLLRLRGAKCESCKQEKWMDLPIPLEIHHIDGNRTNNELCNLQILCCNCHALTDNWRNKKIKLVPPVGLEPTL